MSNNNLTPSDVIARSLATAFKEQLKENNKIYNHPVKQSARRLALPHNISGYEYKNQNNNMILLMHNLFNPNYGSAYATISQIKKLNGRIKRGEYIKGIPIESNFQMYKDEDGKSHYYPWSDDEKKQAIKQKGLYVYWCRRFKTVYNIHGQTEGLDPKYYPNLEQVDMDDKSFGSEILAKTEALAELHGIKISHRNGTPAYYHPDDTVSIPRPKDFRTNEIGYCATLLHELVHGVGNRKRLNFKGHKVQRCSNDRATEELRAELGSVLMCAQLGIPYEEHMENHAAYCSSWIRSIDEDPDYLMKSIKDVVLSSNYLMNLKPEHQLILDSCDTDFQKHLTSMAIASGKDVETQLDDMSLGEPIGNMYVSRHHAFHIAKANEDHPFMPNNLSFNDDFDKSLYDDVLNSYHNKAKHESKSILRILDGDMDFDSSHDPDASVEYDNTQAMRF